MNSLNFSVIGTALGLAFIVVGLGLHFAYRHTLPPGHDPTSQPQAQPDWLTLGWLLPTLRNFLRGAWGCLVFGVALVAAANILGPGLPLTAPDIQVPVSLTYAAALGLLLVILSYGVVHYRVKGSLTNIVQDNAKGEHFVRVHANFTEYVPTGLALLIVLEWSGAPAAAVHVGGALFTFGRYLHAWGYARETSPSLGRILGIQTTLLALSYMVVLSAYYLMAG